MNYYIVDAFAEKAFEGNPAAVCVMDSWPADELMQSIAAELNLSETAFAVKHGDYYQLRWFTPTAEIDLCGHATLATAYVLASFYEQQSTRFRFQTLSGELMVDKLSGKLTSDAMNEQQGDCFQLDFPSRMPEKTEITEQIVTALGIKPLEAYISRDLMLVLENEQQVIEAAPDFEKLKQLPLGLGLSITATGTAYDFVSRSFFPKLGVNEDPVCGSAHCNFIPFWAERLNKQNLIAKQASKRGGILYCQSAGDRVKIGGFAVLCASGVLHV